MNDTLKPLKIVSQTVVSKLTKCYTIARGLAMQTEQNKKHMTKKQSLNNFFKRFNGSAVFSEPKVKLTDKKIERIFRCVQLGSKTTVKKSTK